MDSSPEEVASPPVPSPGSNEDDDDEEEEEDEALPEDDEDDDNNAPPPASSTVIRASPSLASMLHLRDLQKDAISWSLSSAKPGNGVEQVISDESVETYWQSDGSQPHFLRVYFGRRVAVSHVCLYLDYNLDESYTPKTIVVKAGMTIQDSQNVTGHVELHEPVGWCILPLQAPPDPLDQLQEDDDREEEEHAIKTHLVEISILAMHQNGRDTHVRRVKLFGPKRGSQKETARILKQDKENIVLLDRAPNFTTVGMTQFNTIR